MQYKGLSFDSSSCEIDPFQNNSIWFVTKAQQMVNWKMLHQGSDFICTQIYLWRESHCSFVCFFFLPMMPTSHKITSSDTTSLVKDFKNMRKTGNEIMRYVLIKGRHKV